MLGEKVGKVKTKPSQVTVMILDPDPLVHIGVEKILSFSPGIQLYEKAKNYQEALEQLKVTQPDVLLIEVVLPDRSGAEACRDISEAFPSIRVLFLALHHEKSSVYSAVLAGAAGFLLKESARERLVSVIEFVANGHSIFEQDTLKEFQQWILQTRESEGDHDWNLSLQQTRVVELVAKGKTNKEIAQTLELSEKTVRNYLATVFKKLHITHRSRIISLYKEWQVDE